VYVKGDQGPTMPNLGLSPVAKCFWKKETVNKEKKEDETKNTQDQSAKKKLKLFSKALKTAAKKESSKPAAKKANPYENPSNC